MKSHQLPKWIWITGASSGIGKILATSLLGQGHNVIITSRTENALQSIKNRYPENTYILAADISKGNSAEMMTDKLAQITDQLDTVILNAGNCEYVDVDNFDVGIFERVTEVNYLGMIRCVAAALPMLENSRSKPNSEKPHLVGVSSASAFFGLPRAQAYGASKSAVSHFLESLRVDIYRKGIDVSVVYPGFVDTPLTQKNDFPMPGIVSAEQACQWILSGIEKRKHEISFPKKLIWSLKILALLPSSISVKLAQKMVRG